jgi:His-Xaa-Ser system protein HxsD
MKNKENKIVVFLNLKLYSLEAIYGAAYVFLDRAYVYLEEAPKSKVKVTLRSKNRLAEKGLDGLKDEFLNELLNFSLREQISKSNKKIREYIVARALSSASATIMPGRKPMGQEDTQGRKLSEGVIPWTRERFKEQPAGKKEKIWGKDPMGIAVPWEEKYLAKKQPRKKKGK